jgi:hypothetical protein
MYISEGLVYEHSQMVSSSIGYGVDGLQHGGGHSWYIDILTPATGSVFCCRAGYQPLAHPACHLALDSRQDGPVVDILFYNNYTHKYVGMFGLT